MIFRFSDYTLDIDVDRTRAFYARDDRWQCDCQHCQNYRKAIPQAPETVLDFLRSLGVDPTNPIEISIVSDLGEDGTILYNGWFHICGTVVESPETVTRVLDEKGVPYYTCHWELAYRPDTDFYFELLPQDARAVAWIPEDFPAPAVELDICTRLPWVLPTPYRT